MRTPPKSSSPVKHSSHGSLKSPAKNSKKRPLMSNSFDLFYQSLGKQPIGSYVITPAKILLLELIFLMKVKVVRPKCFYANISKVEKYAY
jgi:hypothetical protein